MPQSLMVRSSETLASKLLRSNATCPTFPIGLQEFSTDYQCSCPKVWWYYLRTHSPEYYRKRMQLTELCHHGQSKFSPDLHCACSKAWQSYPKSHWLANRWSQTRPNLPFHYGQWGFSTGRQCSCPGFW